MSGRIMRAVMGLLALALALAFLAVPAIKLKESALVVVLLIGIVAMVCNFVEFVRERNNDT